MARAILDGDWDEFRLGDFAVVNNVWNKGDLSRENGDYTQTVFYDTGDLSENVSFSWDWGQDRNRVVAYPEVIVGFKPWGQQGTGIINAQISEIRKFKVDHDYTLSGDTDLCNVTYDLWLTDRPLGDSNAVTTELMIWSHKGAKVGNFESSAYVADYSHNGFDAKIYTYSDFGDASGGSSARWRYIAVVADRDYDDTKVDVLHILKATEKLGLVSASDYVTGYEFGTEINGGKGRLDIEALSHTFKANIEDESDNVLIGGKDADRFDGLGGNDTIKGRSGDDRLTGGAGSDRLMGGAGADSFVFDSLDGVDRITDFEHHTDRLLLERATFQALGKGDLDKGDFRKGSAFGNDTHLLYNGKTGELFYDADGKGDQDQAHLLAIFQDRPIISASDFEII